MEVPRSSGRPPLESGELSRRKRAILDATLRLVAAQGAGAVRLRDVARASGVSVGSLQYYFDSRDQLIREAFDQHARAVVDLVTAAGDRSATPGARLAAVLEAAVLRPDLHHSAALWMEFVTAGLHDDQLRALLAGAYEAWRDLLGEIVRAGTEAGEFRPLLPAESVVACLVALIDGFELAVAIDVADATPAAILERLQEAAALLTGRAAGEPGLAQVAQEIRPQSFGMTALILLSDSLGYAAYVTYVTFVGFHEFITRGTTRRDSGITATPRISIIASGCHKAVVPMPAMAG